MLPLFTEEEEALLLLFVPYSIRRPKLHELKPEQCVRAFQWAQTSCHVTKHARTVAERALEKLRACGGQPR